MKGKGFLNAGELRAGEKVVDSEGGTYAIENIYIEIVESPETVYNFQYIVRDRNTLILNTRTSQALTQAGISRSQWNAVNRTGSALFEELLTGQLSRNKLTSERISIVRPSGGQ